MCLKAIHTFATAAQLDREVDRIFKCSWHYGKLFSECPQGGNQSKQNDIPAVCFKTLFDVGLHFYISLRKLKKVLVWKCKTSCNLEKLHCYILSPTSRIIFKWNEWLCVWHKLVTSCPIVQTVEMCNICSIWHLQYLLITPKMCTCFGIKYVKFSF